MDERIRMGEDAAFIYPCLLDAQSAACIKTPTYHYRITGRSMSTAYDERLKDIILLPYKRLKEKNADSDFDISSQLDYYLLYMVNFLLRNEAKKANAIQKKSAERLSKIFAQMKIYARRRQGSMPGSSRRTQSCSRRRSGAAPCL